MIPLILYLYVDENFSECVSEKQQHDDIIIQQHKKIEKRNRPATRAFSRVCDYIIKFSFLYPRDEPSFTGPLSTVGPIALLITRYHLVQ